MSKSPAFQFYPGDWLSSLTVTSMTPAQEGAYIRLLALAWGEPDCGLPDDDIVLAQLSRLGEGWLNGGSTLVRKCFFKRGTRLYNKRLLFEKKKQAEHRAKSKEGGLKSGKSRRNKKISGEPNSKGTSNQVEPKLNSSSSSSSSNTKENTQESILCEKQEPLPGFEEPEPLKPKRVMEGWNNMAKKYNLPQVLKLDGERAKSVHARIEEKFFRDNWMTALHKIKVSSWCHANHEKNKTWKASFDWFVRPGTLAKVMEGKYDDPEPEKNEGDLALERLEKWMFENGFTDEHGRDIPETKAAFDIVGVAGGGWRKVPREQL